MCFHTCISKMYVNIDVCLLVCVLLHVSTCTLMHTGSLCTLISAAAAVCCRSLSLTQYAVWSSLQPHLSPSGDSWGYDSPKRSTFLVDLHTWYSGGQGPLAGTLSCQWLLADRPCSPMPHPPLYRSGTCTRHSVPKPGNVARHVRRCCKQLAEWTIWPKALLILFCMAAVELFLPLSLKLLLRHRNDNIAEIVLNQLQLWMVQWCIWELWQHVATFLLAASGKV